MPKVLSQAAKKTKADLLVVGCRPHRGHLRAHGYGIICAVPIPVLSLCLRGYVARKLRESERIGAPEMKMALSWRSPRKLTRGITPSLKLNRCRHP